MFTDIVKPENNEIELFRMAERLGVKSLALYYEMHRDLFDLQMQTPIKLCTAGKSKADVIVKMFGEPGRAQIMIGPEHQQKHSLYAELSKKKIALCFPLSSIIDSKPEKKVSLVENFSRHIRLCRKHKVRIVAATFASDPYHLRSEHDIRSLLTVLGMGTREIKEALDGLC